MKKSFAPHAALIALTLVGLSSCNNSSNEPQHADQPSSASHVDHVLLISVDGLHAADLANYAQSKPGSNLAQLARSGAVYTSAHTQVPSDSFPGLTGILTGASPKTTGIYYDVTFDRSLSPAGSDCSRLGAEVAYDESIDLDAGRVDGGGGLNPALLPRDPRNGCAPVLPHQFLRVNTVFEVVKNHGGRTAWCDKHLSYDLVQGPSGRGVDDLYTPEINANPEDLPGGTTSSVSATEANDELKVQAILQEIGGKDHSGASAAPVPTLFGFNFQAVSVAQKLAGYADASGTPSPELSGALDYVDQSIGRVFAALAARNLAGSTAVILTAKHGQSPIDVTRRRVVDKALLPRLVNGVAPGLLAFATEDDIALLWLTDASRAHDVLAALEQNADALGIEEVLSGSALAELFGDPATDSRAPNLVIHTLPGVVYTSPHASKKAEHGGFSEDDRNVALIVRYPGVHPQRITDQVKTLQIAPTILGLLGLPADELAGAKAEATQPLPGVLTP